MISKCFIRAVVVALAIGSLVGQATAGSASFSVPPAATSAFGTGSVGGSVNLPPFGTSGFNIQVVLPEDYLDNSVFKVVLYLSTRTPSCVARLTPSQLMRIRPGHPLLVTGGLAAQNGSATVAFAASGAVAQKVFTVAPSTAFPRQQRRDALVVTLQREADSADDTCTETVFVQAIDIRYATP